MFSWIINTLFGDETNSQHQDEDIPPLSLRLREHSVTEDNGEVNYLIHVEVKGWIPVQEPTDIAFWTSIFDQDGDNLVPIISLWDEHQESDNRVYRFYTEAGQVLPTYYYPDWITIATVLPDFIQTPYSGKRNIVVLVRMVNMDNVPPILYGFLNDGHPGVLWQSYEEFDWLISHTGFQEMIDLQIKAQAAAIRLAVAVTMMSGRITASEGHLIREWMTTKINEQTNYDSAELKKQFNEAFRESYNDALRGDFSYTQNIQILNEIDDIPSKYETIELLLALLTTNHQQSKHRLGQVHKIAQALYLDDKEIDKIKDQLVLSGPGNQQDDIESLFGLDPNWDRETIHKHLLKAFQRWNNRLNTLPEGPDRDKAQQMLDKIAELRRKYLN